MTLLQADRIGAESPSPRTTAQPARVSPAHVSRRRWLKGLVSGAAMAVAGGTYGREVEPFWVDRHDVPMPLPNLPPSFAGFWIAQLTDLHASTDVPLDYLRKAVDGVREQRPDLVVV